MNTLRETIIVAIRETSDMRGVDIVTVIDDDTVCWNLGWTALGRVAAKDWQGKRVAIGARWRNGAVPRFNNRDLAM